MDSAPASAEPGRWIEDNFDAVAELLDHLRGLPNVKAVVAVRTVDLTADPRLRSLLADNDRVGRVQVDRLPREAVVAALDRLGLQPGEVDYTTVELLRTPLHLAVFARLSPESRRAQHRTLAHLYQDLTSEVRRDVGRRVGHLDWTAIVGTLVEYMNGQETLSAPQIVLGAADPDEVAGLFSAGVLAREGDQVSFFHETYFDHLFAEGFVAAGQDLHDFLASSGQYLFRRAQTRQVLVYLAATDRETFRGLVARLLTSEEIRRHIKGVVVTLLRGLDAEAVDWASLEPIALADAPMAWKVRALLGTPTWFDAADEAGRWEPLLASPTTAAVVENELVKVARDRPARVGELVRPHIGASEEWRQRLRAIVEGSMRPELTELAVELIEQGEVDDARGPVAVNSDFWSIVYGLLQDDPAAAARLTGAYLRRAAVRANDVGCIDPFEAGFLPNSSAGGESHILDVAIRAPQGFVDEVLPFVIAVAEGTASSSRPDALRRTPMWGVRYADTIHTVADAIFHGVERALCALAGSDPEHAMALMTPLLEADIDELRFLGCRGMTATQPSDEAIDWLLADDWNLQVGWAGSPSWATRELIAEATQRCGTDRLGALCKRLLDYYPDRERTAQGRPLRGRTQYELLSAIDPTRLDEQSGRRLKELERRFAATPPTPPQPIEMHAVVPPVPEDAAPQMTDEDWLRAIGKHRNSESDWSGEVPVGGAPELARLLGSQAEAEPERFAALALRFDGDTPVEHLDSVVHAVAGQVPTPMLSRLCQHARGVAGQGVGRAICHAVEKAGADADDVLIGLLEQCGTDPDPVAEAGRTKAGVDDYYGGDLLTAGLDTTRGGAAFAVAKLLYAGSKHADRLATLVNALAQDPIMAVKVWAADATTALLNQDADTALRIAERLFHDERIDIFEARTTARLLRYTLEREPERFACYLRRALDGPDAAARYAGGVWVIAHIRDLLIPPIPEGLSAISSFARLGAAEALRGAPSAAPDLLTRLLDDDEADVRQAAATVMWSIDVAEPEDAACLIEAFVNSQAYPDHFDRLFAALERKPDLPAEPVLVACEEAVALSGRWLGDIRTRHAGASRELVTVVLRLYRQGDAAVRCRCLDVIDRLVEDGAYGVEDALETER